MRSLDFGFRIRYGVFFGTEIEAVCDVRVGLLDGVIHDFEFEVRVVGFDGEIDVSHLLLRSPFVGNRSDNNGVFGIGIR